MAELYLVGFDDTEAARRAVDFAAKRAKASGGSLLLLYVLEWSPYAFLTNEELAERHAQRESELQRGAALVEPVAERLRADGVDCEVLVRHGDPAKLLCEVARERSAVGIVVGRIGGSELASRLLGSLVITLAQASPVPLTVVP